LVSTLTFSFVTLHTTIVDQPETIWKAVRLFEGSKADFADCLIERTGAAHECEYISTFGKHAASTGMCLIE